MGNIIYSFLLPFLYYLFYFYLTILITITPGKYLHLPKGAGSLDKLGKLYEREGDFTKRSITPQDISNMSGFLKRDKKAFEEYALQDAIITLKHAISMEKFNLTVKQLGIPLTLSTIGRN